MPEIAFARTWPKPGRAAGLAAIAGAHDAQPTRGRRGAT